MLRSLFPSARDQLIRVLTSLTLDTTVESSETQLRGRKGVSRMDRQVRKWAGETDPVSTSAPAPSPSSAFLNIPGKVYN